MNKDNIILLTIILGLIIFATILGCLIYERKSLNNVYSDEAYKNACEQICVKCLYKSNKQKESK